MTLPPSQGLEPSANPAQFEARREACAWFQAALSQNRKMTGGLTHENPEIKALMTLSILGSNWASMPLNKSAVEPVAI